MVASSTLSQYFLYETMLNTTTQQKMYRGKKRHYYYVQQCSLWLCDPHALFIISATENNLGYANSCNYKYLVYVNSTTSKTLSKLALSQCHPSTIELTTFLYITLSECTKKGDKWTQQPHSTVISAKPYLANTFHNR